MSTAKLISLVGLLLVCEVLPAGLIFLYGYVSMAGAMFFVFIQVVLLVDFSYAWNGTRLRILSVSANVSVKKSGYHTVGLAALLQYQEYCTWLLSEALYLCMYPPYHCCCWSSR